MAAIARTSQQLRHCTVLRRQQAAPPPSRIFSTTLLPAPRNNIPRGSRSNHLTLSEDLLFKILILLPAESLTSSRFVCKNWFESINTSIFIRCHVQQSETVLICKYSTFLGPTDSAAKPKDKPKTYFHFLNSDKEGSRFVESSVVELGDILASCDGLILATIIGNTKSLMLMNPTTRKHLVLPPVIKELLS